LPSLEAINHRDISLSNILLSDQWKGKPMSEVAFLTDLDNASYYEAGGNSMAAPATQVGSGDASNVGHLNRTVSSTYQMKHRHRH
jgi:hypothetical protein